MTQLPVFRDDIATTTELRRCGVGQSTIERRCRSSGLWRKLLPTVVLLGTAEPNRRQLVRASLAYAGPDAMITGVDALNAYGMKLPVPAQVHVLIPATRRVTSRAFVHIERTTRPPATIVKDEIVYAPPARAAMDAARQLTDRRKLVALLTAPLRRGACSLPELRHELEHGAQRGSALAREVIIEMTANVHSLAERQARRVLAGCPIPPPTWNVPISDEKGALLGVADAWWDEVGLAWDFGANEFLVAGTRTHVRAAVRHHAFTLHRVMVFRTPADELSGNVVPLRRALAEAYLRAAERPRPAVRGLHLHSSPMTALGQ
jgi:hypothetical protein